MMYLVDTGILLRAVSPHDPACGGIRAALRLLRSRHHVLVTSTQNLREFWNVSTRPATSRGGHGRTVGKTAAWVRALRRLLTIVPETNATFFAWSELVQQHQVIGTQVHDANIVAIMQSYAISDLLTLNPNDFRRFTNVHALTPSEILAAP